MAKPKPFARPSITLGRPARVWRTLPAGQVRVGDIVANYGQVRRVEAHAASSRVALDVGSHGLLFFPDSETLFVFHDPERSDGE